MAAVLALTRAVLLVASLTVFCQAFSPSLHSLPLREKVWPAGSPSKRICTPTAWLCQAVLSVPETPTAVHILAPSQAFRNTKTGELSVASCNLLAPTLHALNDPVAVRNQSASEDRRGRVPLAFNMIKRLNADILCLQEVEGGEEYQTGLEQMLQRDIVDESQTIPGYDRCVWSSLHPQRPKEVVGLCVAWRADRFTLASSQAFARGQLVNLRENESGATFCVGNVHLNAFPGQIKARLKVTASIAQRIETCLTRTIASPLDGAALIAGDFNCDIGSVSLRLLQHGSVLPGTVYERNYKQKVTRQEAAAIRHSLRFRDAYAGGLRYAAAPVTVSLTGRGPGSTDHLLFAAGNTERRPEERGGGGRRVAVMVDSSSGNSKRRHRRLKARRRTEEMLVPEDVAPSSGRAVRVGEAKLCVEAVVSTVGGDDSERRGVIEAGLPNVDKGFPSDHLPIGVLLKVADDTQPEEADEAADQESVATGQTSQRKSGVSLNVRRRQSARIAARSTRTRHNSLVRAVAEWLAGRGVTELVQDQPLHRWQWAEGVKGLAKKTRAPDICCVAHPGPGAADEPGQGEGGGEGVLLMVEVTVSSKPEAARSHKSAKYADLAPILATSKRVTDAALRVLPPVVVVLSARGELPPASLAALEDLAQWTAGGGGDPGSERAATNRLGLQLSALAAPVRE